MSTVETTLDTTSLRSGRSGRRGDVVFRGLAVGAGVFVFVLLGAIAVFLVVKAVPALHADKSSFWSTQQWSASAGSAMFGIAALLFGTVVTSLLALVMAVPIALGVSLYITQYAPRRISTLLGYVTDLLAAVPSVVYGLLALLFLLHHMTGFTEFLVRYLGWIPLFSNPNGIPLTYSKSIFAAAVILAVM